MKIVARTENPRQFRPYCRTCGWRKGGPDSWNGVTCKCGETAPVITSVDEIPGLLPDFRLTHGHRNGDKDADE